MRNLIPDWDASGHTPRKKNRNFYFQETLNDFMEASGDMTSIDLGYLGLSLSVVKKGDSRKYYITPADMSYPPLEWKYSSSGMQTSSSIPVLVRYFASGFSFKDAIQRSIISYLYDSDALRQYNPQLEPMDMQKYVHIHIEEPELNLFPSAQCGLIEDIVSKAFNTNSDDRRLRLIMATHSPYIVNYLNVLINRKEEGKLNVHDLAVYRLYNGNLQSLIGEDEKGRKFVDTYDLTEQMEAIMNEYEALTES